MNSQLYLPSEEEFENGIWRFAQFYPKVENRYRISIGEGNTNLIKVDNLFFKCEYENPTGSAKDRSLAYQISRLFQEQVKNAVISSSGNAAISASRYAKEAGIQITVFISQNIHKLKLHHLRQYAVNIVTSPRPVHDASLFAQKKGHYNLRQSKDPSAVIGYKSIAYELQECMGRCDAIFIPVSSGTTLVGIFQGFSNLGYLPSIHLAQSEAVHPVGEIFDTNFVNKRSALTDAIVAKYTPRSEEIIKIVKTSRGFGWVISDNEIMNSRKFLEKNNIFCSFEGAMALSAYRKAIKNGYSYQKSAILLTGRKY